MKRVLVTGGTGFIGANLVRRLLDEGHEVHLLVRPASRWWRLEDVRERLHCHQADLGSPDTLRTAVQAAAPEWVFHLAAHGAYSWQTDTREIMQTNLVGTVNLLQACEGTGLQAFVQAGTSSEYGPKDHAPSEEEALHPDSDYAVFKAAATLYGEHMARSRGLPVVTLRLYSVYGPYEEPGRLVPNLIVQGLAGKLPPLVDPHTARDFVYVEDVLDAFVRAAERSRGLAGRVYNLGTGVQSTLAEMVSIAREVLGIAAEPQWGSMPPRSWDTNVWVANAARARTGLAWSPRYSLREGFARTVEWFCSRPALLEHYRRHAR